MMMMTNGNKRESKFQREVIAFLENKGAYVEKMHVSSYQRGGSPDIRGCYKGRYFAFELKKQGGVTSSLQKIKIQRIRDAGGVALSTSSLEEIKEVLHEISRVQSGGKPER